MRWVLVSAAVVCLLGCGGSRGGGGFGGGLVQPGADSVGQPSNCTKQADCNDGDPCTSDICNAISATCEYVKLVGCGQPTKPCGSADDCGAALVCDLQKHICVQCVKHVDCGVGKRCVERLCIASAVCESDVQCKSVQGVCDKSAGVCVPCLTHADCAANELCTGSGCVTKQTCVSSKDCPAVCDVAKKLCVTCLASADCPAGHYCTPTQACKPVACSGAACAGNTRWSCNSEGSGYKSALDCVDSDPCTEDGCVAGECSFQPAAVGASCGTRKVCGGNGTCVCAAKFTGPNCGQCVDPKLAGPKCEQCLDPWVTGPQCDQCADPNSTPPACGKQGFWLVYGRNNRLPGAPDTDNDLVLTGIKNPGALTNSGLFGCGISPFQSDKKCIELTKYAFGKAKGLSCNYGCKLSANMKYVAIAKSAPDKNGLFTYVPGTIEHYPSSKTKFLFFIDKFEPINNVRDLHFAGPYLYYSTPIYTFKTGKSQYEVRRRHMKDLSKGEQVIALMPPKGDPDANPANPHTTYTGRFHVSETGNTLVFLTPTIRSMKVWSWSGGNLIQHDYICENPLDEVTCVGTGSQYNDNDAVGISSDGKTIILFAIVGRYFRVRKYTVGTTEGSTFSNLITLPVNANYKKDVCFHLPKHIHSHVKGRPQFSADGQRVYFLGQSQCGGMMDKMWNDILSIKVAAIGGKIDASKVVNHTNNPRNSSFKNRWVRHMTLSPDKKVFVFNASPTYNMAGAPYTTSTDKRQLKDTEVYIMPTQPGYNMIQITNESSYDVHAPVAVAAIGNP